jgi:hypothetical protein
MWLGPAELKNNFSGKPKRRGDMSHNCSGFATLASHWTPSTLSDLVFSKKLIPTSIGTARGAILLIGTV